MEPLGLAVRRAIPQHHAMRDIRLFLGGPAEAWEPLAWQVHDKTLCVSQRPFSHSPRSSRSPRWAPIDACSTRRTGRPDGGHGYRRSTLTTVMPATEGTTLVQTAAGIVEMSNAHHAIWLGGEPHRRPWRRLPALGDRVRRGAQFVRVHHNGAPWLPPVPTTWPQTTHHRLTKATPGALCSHCP